MLVSAGAAVLFGVLYQCSLSTALTAGVIAGISWAFALGVGTLPHTIVLADLAGAFLVGSLAEGGAVLRREPVSLLVVPAIIPFVPGYQAYQSMLAFIQGHFVRGLEAGMGSVLVAGALAVGLALATALTRPLARRLLDLEPKPYDPGSA
jgi:uncharacterized membrane protein YjjB (DUF3815 family)